jgi:hypothetical protein
MASHPPTSFQVLSDLHLEIDPSFSYYERYTNPPRVPNLALLGDIGDIGTIENQDPITGPFALFLHRQLT